MTILTFQQPALGWGRWRCFVFATAMAACVTGLAGGGHAATQWQPLTLEWAGPSGLDELNSAVNPFLDYRLNVTVTHDDSGAAYRVPGYYAGNDALGRSQWRMHFTPDRTGSWSFETDFRAAPGVAVLLDAEIDPQLHPAASFHGRTGGFSVTGVDASAPGFLSRGRLAYTGGHYLRTLGDGRPFIKTGSNSPENLLGYAGFDNTLVNGGDLHTFADHVPDWNPGDPTFTTTNPQGDLPGAQDGKGLIGAVNYLADRGVNAVYFLPNNIGGDGRDTSPYADPDLVYNGSAGNDNLRFDNSKLAQWELVFDQAQRRGVMLHVVLNEAEGGNKNELDDGKLGVERKLYYRELVARFGHHNALQWNLSEEYNRNRGSDSEFSPDTVKQFAAYLSAVDPYDHPVSVHNGNYIDWPNESLYPEQHAAVSSVGQHNEWEPFFGHGDFDVVSFQRYNENEAGDDVEYLRRRSAEMGRPIPVMIDEPESITSVDLGPTEHGNTLADAVRRRLTYDILLSGGGVEWFVRSDDTSLEDFRTFEQVYREGGVARAFMEDHLPLPLMTPDDDLIRGADTDYGGVEVLALPGETYAFYLPEGSNDDNALHPEGFPELDLRGVTAVSALLHWFNPRTGAFEGDPLPLLAGDWASLGATPDGQGAYSDWVGLVTTTVVIPEPVAAALLPWLGATGRRRLRPER